MSRTRKQQVITALGPTASAAMTAAAQAAAQTLLREYVPNGPAPTAAQAAAGLLNIAAQPPRQATLPPAPVGVGPPKAPTQREGWAELVQNVHRSELLQVLAKYNAAVDPQTSDADLRLIATALVLDCPQKLADGSTPLCKVSDASFCPLKRFLVTDAQDFVHVNTPQGHSLQTEALRQQRRAAELGLAPHVLVFHPHGTNAVQVVTANLAWPPLGYQSIAQFQASGGNAAGAYQRAQEAVKSLHASGITHNNLTFDNVLVRPSDGAVRFEGWTKAAAVSSDPAQARDQLQADQLPPLNVLA